MRGAGGLKRLQLIAKVASSVLHHQTPSTPQYIHVLYAFTVCQEVFFIARDGDTLTVTRRSQIFWTRHPHPWRIPEPVHICQEQVSSGLRARLSMSSSSATSASYARIIQDNFAFIKGNQPSARPWGPCGLPYNP